MLDIILASFAALVFYGGFKAGAKFQTFKAMGGAAKAQVKAWVA